MKFRIRRVCFWIISVQVILIVLHVKLYQSFTGLYSSSIKKNVSHLLIYNTRENKSQLTIGNSNLHNKFENDVKKSKMGNLETLINSDKKFTQLPTHKVIINHTVKKDRHNSSQRLAKKTVSLTQKCNYTELPSRLEGGDHWQPVDKGTAFVFSSYYVEKTRTILIIGTRSRHHIGYTCLLWHERNGELSTTQVTADVKQLPEGHELWYSAVFFECKLTRYNNLPSYVSLVTLTPCSPPVNIMKVHKTTSIKPYPRRFTVCLTPLNNKYSHAYELVEWIELNRIMGAEKFIIYNYSISNNTAEVLDYYTRIQLVDIVQWALPLITDTENGTKLPEIHYFGQTVALHDCLYRNKAESEFIINTDLDEFIVPHHYNTSNWSDMMKQLPNEPGAYIFRSTFYRKEWESVYLSNKYSINKYRLITLQKLNHEEHIFPTKRRSKYFARTFECRQLLIHSVQFLPTKKKAHSVAVQVGLVHHYRDWDSEIPLPEVKVFDDTIPRKYSQSLIERVTSVWSVLKHVKMD